MACTLNTGRAIPCKSSVGGLKTVYFADYGLTVTDNATDAEKVDIGGTPTFYQYDLKGNSSLETTVNSSRENGTTFFESNLNMTLQLLDSATQEELKIIALGRPQVVVEDYNGNFFLLGREHGCEVTGGTFSSGAAMGDASQFSITLTAQEISAPAFLADSTDVTGNASATQITPATPNNG